MRFRIHVSGVVLARNAERGTTDPAIIIRTEHPQIGGGTVYSFAMATMVRPAKKIPRPDWRIVQAGPRVYVETDGPIELENARFELDPDHPRAAEDTE